MTHVDPKRKKGGYCTAKCELCYLAACWTLQGRGGEVDAILRGRGPSSVKLGADRPGVIGGTISAIRRRMRRAHAAR